nr:hypothetical protein Q903MT_gene554 [Picea sitchensis]
MSEMDWSLTFRASIPLSKVHALGGRRLPASILPVFTVGCYPMQAGCYPTEPN